MIGKRVLIRRDIFEEYLRILRRKENAPEQDENMESEDNDMRQGALTLDAQTGRMDIRFDLENYYGGLHCGDCLDILINGKWVPTRIEMGDGWYLTGIKADNLEGLIVMNLIKYLYRRAVSNYRSRPFFVPIFRRGGVPSEMFDEVSMGKTAP